VKIRKGEEKVSIKRAIIPFFVYDLACLKISQPSPSLKNFF